MKRSLNKMNTTELRNLAAALGCDKKKLYGTTKQSIIITITDHIHKWKAKPENQKRLADVADYIDKNYKSEC